ncbi:MAG TPA: methyltransferase domain-containing protein [Geminicoccaceae bacterium]
MAGDFTTREEVLGVYRKRARHYDLTANSYYLLGFREWAYRKRAIAALGLRPGDTVVEIGCGTGLNFELLEERIGPQGRLIGVDLRDAMLARARQRVRANGWRNVELVECAGASFRFPPGVDGVLSIFALTLEPDREEVIERGAKALRSGRRWVILDLKMPSHFLRHLAPALIVLVRPFAVSGRWPSAAPGHPSSGT